MNDAADCEPILLRLLKGRTTVDSYPEPILVRIACSGALADLLRHRGRSREADEIRDRYQTLFHHTVLGVYEDLLDGRRHRMPAGFSLGEQGRMNGIILVRHLFEERAGWSAAKIRRQCSKAVFVEHGLSGVLQRAFGSSPFAAIDAAYPGRFKPWELPNVSVGYWNGPEGTKHVVEAVRWMIEERCCWTDEDVKARISRAVFGRHGLGGLMSGRCRGSAFAALEEAYPGRFKPWELIRAPQSYWLGSTGRAHAVAATRWLVEERLAWNQAQVKLLLSARDFHKNSLGGLLCKHYRYCVWRALEEAYPGRYRRDELYSFGKIRAHRDPLVVAFVEPLRVITDAARLGTAAACRRHGWSSRKYESLRRAVRKRGVEAFLPKATHRVVTIRVQRAVLALTHRRPLLTAAEISRALAAKNIKISVADVERLWKSHCLTYARSRYRLVAENSGVAAADLEARRRLAKRSTRGGRPRFPGDRLSGFRWPSMIDAETERVVLSVVSTNPGLGRDAIVREARRRGHRISNTEVRAVLMAYRLRTVGDRIAACGLPRVLRRLAEAALAPLRAGTATGRPGS